MIAANAAVAEAAHCATEAKRLRTSEAKALKVAAGKVADQATTAARVAKYNFKLGRQRASRQAGSSAQVPAAAADSGEGAPPAPAERPSRSQLDTSGPVMKCPEEMERLERCTIYEVRLQPV